MTNLNYLGVAGPAAAPRPPSAFRKSRVEFLMLVGVLVAVAVVSVVVMLSVGFGFCFSTMMKLSSLLPGSSTLGWGSGAVVFGGSTGFIGVGTVTGFSGFSTGLVTCSTGFVSCSTGLVGSTGGTGSTLGGTGVSFGGTGVSLGGTGVSLGRRGVSLGGTGSGVEGTSDSDGLVLSPFTGSRAGCCCHTDLPVKNVIIRSMKLKRFLTSSRASEKYQSPNMAASGMSTNLSKNSRVFEKILKSYVNRNSLNTTGFS